MTTVYLIYETDDEARKAFAKEVKAEIAEMQRGELMSLRAKTHLSIDVAEARFEAMEESDPDFKALGDAIHRWMLSDAVMQKMDENHPGWDRLPPALPIKEKE